MNHSKILVVDDEPDFQQLIRQKFRSEIKNNKYEFQFAINGAEALEKLQNDESIFLVLTDINMPVMDGLTLLTKINEMNSRLLRTVIISAYGDMENIRTAMNRGAYDFITKPINLNDLEITITKSLIEIEQHKEAIKNRDKLIALQQELDIARVIQTSILPKYFPPFPERKEFDIYANMIAAKEVGGDFYDFFLIDKYRLGLVIGDVSGKGIASALLMAVCKTLLKATAFKGSPTNNILSEVNNILVEESPSNMFVTVFYGVLDTRSGEFEYCNGGHNPPYLITKQGIVKQVPTVGGLLLGALKDAEYQSNVITIYPGESLIFYTDGVTEAFNNKGEEFNQKRLEEVLIKNDYGAKEFVDHVCENVRIFSKNAEQSDDITCMVLKYLKQ